MTPLRWAIVVFWVIVLFMIVKSCRDSEEIRHNEAVAHPQEQEFFYTTPPPGVNAPAATPTAEATADVRQITYSVQKDTPTTGDFTAQVTVKNVGGKKAVNVQVHVRPYRGAAIDSSDIGPVLPPLTENDPLSQYGSWITFPDLAPGESSTATAVFLTSPRMAFGKNSKPEIVFQTAPDHP